MTIAVWDSYFLTDKMNSRTLLLSLAAAVAAVAPAQDFKPSMSVGGVLRSRWELSTAEGSDLDNRFAIRNARLWVDGKASPDLQYCLRADFCDMGKVKFLDGWARMRLAKSVSVQAGQFRIPFGRDTFKAPGHYLFANRSFLGRDGSNVRAAGVQLMLSHPTLPLTLNTGVFSPHSIGDHTPWSNDMTFASKAVFIAGMFEFTGGFQSISPYGLRMNMADAAVTLNCGRFTAEAEYMYTHYAHNLFQKNYVYNTWASYGVPLRKGKFDKLSFMTRWEGMNAHSTGKLNADGALVADTPDRQRLTLGTSVSYNKKPVKYELQLNYERYFYSKNYTPSADRDDKLLAEFILLF